MLIHVLLRLAILYWNGDHREMYYWAARILVLSLTKGSVSHSGAACMLVCSGFTTLYGKYDIVEVCISREQIDVKTKD